MGEKPSQNPVSQTVWLNEQARIASFHSVAGYEERSFRCRDYFMGFLNNLQEQCFCFR